MKNVKMKIFEQNIGILTDSSKKVPSKISIL
jgi:hypothetical protein